MIMGGRMGIGFSVGRISGRVLEESLLGASDQVKNLAQGDVQTRLGHCFRLDEDWTGGSIGRRMVSHAGRCGDAGLGRRRHKRRVAAAERTPGRERRVRRRLVAGSSDMDGTDGMAAVEGGRLAEGAVADGAAEESVDGGG